MVLGRLVTQVTRFGVSILLARLLSPEAFALVAIAMTVILALEVVRDLGTGAAVIQRREVDEGLLSTVFALNLVTGLLLAGGMALGAGGVAALFDAPEAAPVVRVLAVVVALQGAVQTHHAVLRRDMRFRGVALVEMVGALLTATVSVTLALLGMGVWAMVWGNVAGVAAGSALAWVVSGWRPRARVAPRRLREIAHFGLNTAGFNVVKIVLREADKVLVSRALGAGALGIYSLGQRTIRYPVESVSQVLMTVLFPAFSRVQDDDALLRRGYGRAAGAIAFVVLPLMVGTALVADPLVHAVLGEQWTGLIPLLQFMAPAGAVGAVTTAVNTIYSAKGRADYMLRVGLFRGALTLAFVAIGLHWGLLGLAVGYLAAMVVQAPIGLHFALRMIGMPMRALFRVLLPYVLLVAAMAAGVLGVLALLSTASDGAQLLVATATGLGVYVALALWWRPPAVRDMHVLLTYRERG